MITQYRLWKAGRAVARAEAERLEDEAVDAFLKIMRDTRHDGRRVPLRQQRRRMSA